MRLCLLISMVHYLKKKTPLCVLTVNKYKVLEKGSIHTCILNISLQTLNCVFIWEDRKLWG